ncbi:MAG: hypothetical protein IJR07_00235 [Bacteroidaceae bacterium]|nr:hypothetical protein [Bacteroidaceae bacterium]
MEKDNEKRVLRVELNDEVKKVSITGKDSDEKVVMRQELDEDELDMVTGGVSFTVDDEKIDLGAMDFSHGTACGSDGWWQRGNNELNPVQFHAYGGGDLFH